MADQNNSDNFSFGPVRNAAKTYGPSLLLQQCQESAVFGHSGFDGSLTACAERRRTEALQHVILPKPDVAASSLACVLLRVSGCGCGSKGQTCLCVQFVVAPSASSVRTSLLKLIFNHAGPVDDINCPSSANTVPLADASSTSLPASTPLNRGSAASVDADEAATPVGGIGMPTPAGPMGRGVSLPPTPFAPPSMTPGSSAFASFVAPAWRSRTSNAAFKGRSPSSSRSAHVFTCTCHCKSCKFTTALLSRAVLSL